MDRRVKEVLSWYSHENPGVRTNIARMLNHGHLAGTGKLIILPADQGFELGPTPSFAPNPASYDPHYHFQFVIEAGCSAYAAPLGFLEAGAAEFAGEIPLILKCNNHDLLDNNPEPLSAVTASVEDALRLGCVAIGFTIYPGSARCTLMYQQLQEITLKAKRAGLAVVVWAYPRGSFIGKEGWTAADTVAYAAHIAAQMGANIIKVKPPIDNIVLTESRNAYQKYNIPLSSMADRVRHIVQSAFNGRRIVVFAGGPTTSDKQVLDEVHAICNGGGFGSIIGRNLFQRPKEDALELINKIADIYKKEG